MYKSFKKHFFSPGGEVTTVAGSRKADACTHKGKRLSVASTPADSPAPATHTAPGSFATTELVVLGTPARSVRLINSTNDSDLS